MKGFKDRLIIKLIKHKNLMESITVLMIMIGTCLIVNNGIIYGMERRQLQDAVEGLGNGTLSEHDVEDIFQRINNMRDNGQIEELREFINRLSLEHNYDLNVFLQPHLQHAIRTEGGNSGNVHVEHTTWKDTAVSIGIAAGFTILGYILIRNWPFIRDLLFDIGQRAIHTLPEQITTDQIINVAQGFLTNPTTRGIFIFAFRQRFPTIVPQDSA
jgi:hypothetical protein